MSVCNVLKGIGVHGFSDAGGFCFYGIAGGPLFVWAPLALSPRLSLGPIGPLLIFMGVIRGPWIPLLSSMSLS